MTSPTQTEPPFVPLRHHGWATKRTPLWVIAALVIAVAAAVVLSLTHKPSKSELASDLGGYFGDVQAGIGSCAAGLHDSENAYGQLISGAAVLNKNAESVFTYGASNCTLTNNEALTDFGSYQVAQSLDSYNLDTADLDVIAWSVDSTTAQTDMLAVLQAATPAARASAQATLNAALVTLDNQRAAIDRIWNSAKKATGSTAAYPSLPTWTPPAS